MARDLAALLLDLFRDLIVDSLFHLGQRRLLLPQRRFTLELDDVGVLLPRRFSNSCMVAASNGAACDSVSLISVLQLGQVIAGSVLGLPPPLLFQPLQVDLT